MTLDSDGSTEQRTTTDALATLFAGDGLAAASAVMKLDLNELTAASVDVAAATVVIGPATVVVIAAVVTADVIVAVAAVALELDLRTRS